MSKSEESHSEKARLSNESISRREFLKLAGVTGAAVGLGTGLGGLIAACGEEGTTTTSGAATSQATTATSAGSTTTVSVAAEMGREIRIGSVQPVTGPLGAFGIADVWATKVTEEVVGDGIVLGDGKKHPITIVAQDCQSDSNRSAQVAGDLILNEKVDILLGSVAPDVTNPSADQAEALGCPYLTNYSPWNAFVFGRGADLKTPFKWTYGHCMGTEQMMYSILAAVDEVPNNKRCAFITHIAADGEAWLDEKAGAPVALRRYGYEMASVGRYNVGAEDYTSLISQFRKDGCDVLVGAMITPDFVNFWKQALQQGFNPKVPAMGLALAVPQAQEGLGSVGIGLITEQGWNPNYPFTDPLTGMTCQELAERWEKDTGLQRTNAIGHLGKFAWAIDVLKRTKDPDDKESILDAIKTTKMTVINGPIDFTTPIDPDPSAPESFRPHPNVCKPVYSGGQWVKGTKWPAEEVIVSNICAPMVETVPVVPYVYS